MRERPYRALEHAGPCGGPGSRYAGARPGGELVQEPLARESFQQLREGVDRRGVQIPVALQHDPGDHAELYLVLKLGHQALGDIGQVHLLPPASDVGELAARLVAER